MSQVSKNVLEFVLVVVGNVESWRIYQSQSVLAQSDEVLSGFRVGLDRGFVVVGVQGQELGLVVDVHEGNGLGGGDDGATVTSGFYVVVPEVVDEGVDERGFADAGFTQKQHVNVWHGEAETIKYCWYFAHEIFIIAFDVVPLEVP